MKGNATSSTEINFDVFTDFVLRELATGERSYGSLHWIPSSDLCDVCSIKYDFIGKVETLRLDLGLLTQRHGDLADRKVQARDSLKSYPIRAVYTGGFWVRLTVRDNADQSVFPSVILP
jgi:hypothetical protein